MFCISRAHPENRKISTLKNQNIFASQAAQVSAFVLGIDVRSFVRLFGREIAAKLQQSKEENEELNKLTGEMQSAHARLLVMFQNLAEQKKGESAAATVAADSGEIQVDFSPWNFLGYSLRRCMGVVFLKS
jgi:hypothetical protein